MLKELLTQVFALLLQQDVPVVDVWWWGQLALSHLLQFVRVEDLNLSLLAETVFAKLRIGHSVLPSRLCRLGGWVGLKCASLVGVVWTDGDHGGYAAFLLWIFGSLECESGDGGPEGSLRVWFPEVILDFEEGSGVWWSGVIHMIRLQFWSDVLFPGVVGGNAVRLTVGRVQMCRFVLMVWFDSAEGLVRLAMWDAAGTVYVVVVMIVHYHLLRRGWLLR